MKKKMDSPGVGRKRKTTAKKAQKNGAQIGVLFSAKGGGLLPPWGGNAMFHRRWGKKQNEERQSQRKACGTKKRRRMYSQRGEIVCIARKVWGYLPLEKRNIMGGEL